MGFIFNERPDGKIELITEDELREKRKAAFLMPILLVFLLIAACFFVVSNALDTSTIKKWGYDQYFNNILHLHSDKCVQFNGEMKEVYLFKTPNINYENSTKGVGSFYKVPGEATLLFKGYRKVNDREWDAVIVNVNGKFIQGWTPIDLKYSAHAYEIDMRVPARNGFGVFDDQCNFTKG